MNFRLIIFIYWPLSETESRLWLVSLLGLSSKAQAAIFLFSLLPLQSGLLQLEKL